MQTTALSVNTNRLVDWLVNDALPVWIEHGVDRDTGCCYDQITTALRPVLSNDHRLRLHAQQIYVLTRAESLGWVRGLHSLVKLMNGFVSRKGTLPCRSDGYVRSLDAGLRIRASEHSVADHAFFMMSSAASFAAFGDGAEQRRAVNILKWLDRRFSHSKGGWAEGTELLDHRRQSTHMYLLQAFLFLYEITRRERWLARANEICQLSLDRFIRFSDGLMRESYDDSLCAKPDAANWVIPAHQFNWIWLLGRMAHFGGADVGPYVDRLYSAVSGARDPDLGLYYRRIKPGGSVLDKHLPLDTQTQLIKACLAIAQTRSAAEREQWERRAAESIDGLFRHFLLREPLGLWRDHAQDPEGPQQAASASFLFHLADAAMAARDYIKRGG